MLGTSTSSCRHPPTEPAPREDATRAFLDAFDDAGWDMEGFAQGEVFDATHGAAEFLRLNPLFRGPVPGPPFSLTAPHVVVSLDGLTCRLFDEKGDFERVYPIGVGVRAKTTGESITPVGSFNTHPDRKEGWFYIWRRWVPKYFGGLPFLRIDAVNSDGGMTYGLHGPISTPLKRGYVSHGCIRMRGDDVKELFTVMYAHPGSPVTIQKERDYDRYGIPFEVGYPRFHVASAELPPIRLAEALDVKLVIRAPSEAVKGDEIQIGCDITGADAIRVRRVLYNEGPRWDQNLSAPVGPRQTIRARFTSAGLRRLYAVALDEVDRPVGFGSHEIRID